MCDTCQDCGCDNITLPVPVGTAGATGAPGAAGANGTNGTTVLHNDMVRSTTTSGSISLFNTTKAYTLPSGTLSTDGSKLRLRALFSSTGGTEKASSTAYIFIGGSSFTSLTIPYTLEGYSRDTILEVDLLINRVNSTELFITSNSVIADSNGPAKVLAANVFTARSHIVSDMDSNNLLIECRGKTASTTSFNCDQLTIDHLIK